MSTLLQLSESEFERILTPDHLRPIQIVHVALMTAATMFAFVVVLLYFQSSSTENVDVEVVNILTGVHALFAFGAFGISRILTERMFTERYLNNAIDTATAPYEDSLSVIRVALIVRMAMLEGVSIFGLVVCVIAVTSGIAKHEPLYLFNMASYVLFIAIGINTFPTKDAVMDIFRRYILKRY